MKKLILCVLIMVITFHVNAQSIDPVSLIIAKVIKAIDLKIQQMQNETIWLQHAQQVAENVLSKTKLAEIRDWQNKQVELYDNYFEELKKVKASLKNLPQVKQILAMQAQVVQEYGRMVKHPSLQPSFDQLMMLSKDILTTLPQLLNSNVLTMKDGERLLTLTKLRDAMADCLDSIKALNSEAARLNETKTIRQTDIQFMKKLNAKP